MKKRLAKSKDNNNKDQWTDVKIFRLGNMIIQLLLDSKTGNYKWVYSTATIDNKE